ncbi:hypothetical protein [Victivallis sp. Marseille-Q1083]|uniref:hypothetical protein n=1 Tax=Victivallis sp. Marseille-Q1083 TaxID=2717288 RepID=UPI00158C51AF|nr:hypothetical protein [Victivallis sp. Marseille-Q1083]
MIERSPAFSRPLTGRLLKKKAPAMPTPLEINSAPVIPAVSVSPPEYTSPAAGRCFF